MIAFHCFCIKIALGDVNLCFSLILILLNKDKHTTKMTVKQTRAHKNWSIWQRTHCLLALPYTRNSVQSQH